MVPTSSDGGLDGVSGASAPGGLFDDLQIFFELAPDALVVVDGHGSIRRVNLEAERLFGWPRDELVGQSVEMLVPVELRAAHVRHRSASAGPRRSMGAGLALRARRRDGGEVPVDIALRPLGTTGSVLAAVRDQSEREAAEHAAALALERLVSALESFDDAFAIFDRDERLVLCNAACLGHAPRCADASAPRSYATLVEALDARAPSVAARLAAQPRSGGTSLDLETTDGRMLRWVERVTPEGGRVVTIVDLSDDVRRERELRVAREAAETANSAKTEFLRSMSHELRTPLNAILGFTQLLQRDASLGERPKRFVEHVLRGGEHLLRLIDDVLDLARVESGVVPLSLEPVHSTELLDDVRATLAPLAERRSMRIEVVPSPVPPVRADRTRLRQIVLNFASNAVKYGRENGRVSLEARVEGEHVRVIVRDDGPGIPLERQGKLFSAFYRAGQETGPVEGTGIGLALSRRLAEMMGGTVGFTSTPASGAEPGTTEFWVELVKAEAAAAPSAGRAREHAALPATQESSVVLYVEDNPANIAFMNELLAGMPNVQLIVAPTGEIGVELAKAHRPAVVILDINLPGISGFEVLQILRSSPETKDTPILALSASAMERDVKRAEEAGFTRYLTKPVKVDLLLHALATALGR